MDHDSPPTPPPDDYDALVDDDQDDVVGRLVRTVVETLDDQAAFPTIPEVIAAWGRVQYEVEEHMETLREEVGL